MNVDNTQDIDEDETNNLMNSVQVFTMNALYAVLYLEQYDTI